jgi:hypothetical protein
MVFDDVTDFVRVGDFEREADVVIELDRDALLYLLLDGVMREIVMGCDRVGVGCREANRSVDEDDQDNDFDFSADDDGLVDNDERSDRVIERVREAVREGECVGEEELLAEAERLNIVGVGVDVCDMDLAAPLGVMAAEDVNVLDFDEALRENV